MLMPQPRLDITCRARQQEFLQSMAGNNKSFIFNDARAPSFIMRNFSMQSREGPAQQHALSWRLLHDVAWVPC